MFDKQGKARRCFDANFRPEHPRGVPGLNNDLCLIVATQTQIRASICVTNVSHARNGHEPSGDPEQDFQRVVDILSVVHKSLARTIDTTVLSCETASFPRKRAGDFKHGRWCSWGFTSRTFCRKYSSILLCVLWSGIEACTLSTVVKCLLTYACYMCQEGKNPFALAKTTEGSFEKVMDQCVKAGPSFSA